MVGKEKLKEIIVSNREFIDGEISNVINRENIFLPKKLNKVMVFYGVRRSGKSFILYDLIKKHFYQSLYIDFEDERLVDFTSRDFDVLKEAFLELFPEVINKEKYFFLDEIQNVEGWEKFCRRMTEKENINVFVAGSSSKILPLEIHTSLRGREWSIEISPFSFKEYLLAKDISLNNECLYGSKQTIVKNHFLDYMQWGGFPEVCLSKNKFEKRKLLDEYMGAMFFKDLVERFNMNNTALMDSLEDRLFTAFSLEFSLNAFYRQYKNKFSFSKDKLYEYYSNFIKSMLVYKVEIFSESSYKRQRNPGKIYIVDSGLARRVTSQDKGRILENIVFLELRKKAEKIFYFSENRECDFVVKKNNKFCAYQVCYELNDSNREREIDGLVECCKRLDSKVGIILTNGQEEKIKDKGVEIEILPVWKWLIIKPND